MPALPSVTKTIRVNMVFNLVPGISGCRFFVSYTGGPPSAADLNSFATLVHSDFSSYMASLMDSSYTLTQVNTLDLDTPSGNSGLWSGSVAGTRTGNSLTAASCAVVDFKIGRHYRGGKPRIYLPFGVFTDLQNTQTWSSSFTAAVTAGWGSFMAGILAATYTSFNAANHVNVSYYSGYNTSTPPWRGPGFKYPPKVRTGPITPDFISNHSTRVTIGSQRRRLTAA